MCLPAAQRRWIRSRRYGRNKPDRQPLAGNRTWGGLVGICDCPKRIDGGGVTAPRVGWAGLGSVPVATAPPGHPIATTPLPLRKPSTKPGPHAVFPPWESHLTQESTLQNHAFASGLADRHIAQLTSLASEVIFREDELILADGQESEFFYLVTSGSVTIELHTATFTVSVLTVGPGQAFGWSAFLDHQNAVFQVRARERTTALRIAGPDLTAACRSDPAMGVEILLRTLDVVAGRIRATEARFAELCGVRTAPRR